jgi:glycosyltransferase involved in cell wall biosynthesis
MLIVSNLPGLPRSWTASSGERGESATAMSVPEFLAFRRHPDAVWVVNCDPALTFKLAAASAVAPFLVKPLICVDLVLRRSPRSFANPALPVKRWLLRHVAHFIHHFRDLRAYEAVFGIGPDRSSFVPFKANLRDRYHLQPNPHGDYVLCFGRSMRDYDTFFSAMERLPYPAAIARPDIAQLRAHGARFTRPLDQLPANVRILEDDGTAGSQLRIMNGAKLLVLPVVRSGMVASISVGLNAMLMGKCVIGSEGPGMSDIFNGLVLTVPPENASELAEVIRRAWEDDGLRTRLAAAGHQYALTVGGEPELFQRIIDQVVAWSRAGTRVRDRGRGHEASTPR